MFVCLSLCLSVAVFRSLPPLSLCLSRARFFGSGGVIPKRVTYPMLWPVRAVRESAVCTVGEVEGMLACMRIVSDATWGLFGRVFWAGFHFIS